MPFQVTNNATTTLAAGVSSSDTIFTVATGTGNLFPVLETTNEIDYFYVRFGTDQTNEIKKCTARSTDTFTCNAFSSNWSSGTTVKLTVCSQLFDELPRIITTDTTYTVKSSGGTFTSLQNALMALGSILITPPAVVTIQLDPGEWNVSGGEVAETLLDSSRFLSPQQIKFVGEPLDSLTITSIQSSSGSSGAWSIVLNLSSLGSVAVDHYIFITEVLTGGSNPEFLMGCHKITNVDVPNTRITIECLNRTATAPSGAVSGTVSLCQTRIYCQNSPGPQTTPLKLLNSSFSEFNNLIFIKGAFVQNGSLFVSNVGSTDTIELISGKLIAASNSFLVSTGTSYQGISLDLASMLWVNWVVLSGYEIGINAMCHSTASLGSSNIVGCITGVSAFSKSYVFVGTSGFFSNSTDCDPTVNTQGNKYALIDNGS